MKSFIFTLLTTLTFTSVATARDSTWLLCNDDKLVINLHEHRAGAATRETTVHLIHGVHILIGTIKETDSDQVSLRGAKNLFKGRLNVDYQKSLVTLNGTLSLYGEKFEINSSLNCQEMTGNLD